MVKNIIKYFGYFIAILVIIIMYLSYFGIETKQFNELIKDRVEPVSYTHLTLPTTPYV